MNSTSISIALALNKNKNNMVNQDDTELTLYLTSVYSIFKIITSNNKYQDKQFNYNFVNKFIKGPIDNYKYLHLEDYQKKYHSNTYAPVLLSKDFRTLYTNTGMIDLSGFNIILKGAEWKNIIETLNLKIYNNSYYYIDKPYSFDYLQNHYKENKITEIWQSILTQ